MGKRVLLLTVLALALPAAAFANSGVDFTNSRGTLLGTNTGLSLSCVTFTAGALASSSLALSGSASRGTVQLTINPGKGSFNGSTQISSGDTNIAVPEPGTLTLMGAGLIGLARLVRRNLKARPKS